MTSQTGGTTRRQPRDERPTAWTRSRALIFADVAWYGPPSWAGVIKAAVTQRTYRPVLTLRLAQATSGPLGVLMRFAHRWACNQACVDLPRSLEAGPGLKLTHGWGVVVHPGARLGRDVILMHGATIGRRGDSVPVIDDGAFIGPQASVLGGVTIGRGATISAGCVITRDVPDHTMITLDRASLTSIGYERPSEKPDWA
jgi:serine O-acetyltransferase